MNIRNQNPGKLKDEVKYLENCSEIELFIQINSYYQFLEQLKLINFYHKMHQLYKMQGDLQLSKHFKKLENIYLERVPSESEKKELEDTLNFCILQTKRFNTGVHVNSTGKIEITDQFENWYYSWIHYIEKMDDETYMFYRKCRYEGKGLEQFQLNQTNICENINSVLEKPKIKKYCYPNPNKNIRQKLA